MPDVGNLAGEQVPAQCPIRDFVVADFAFSRGVVDTSAMAPCCPAANRRTRDSSSPVITTTIGSSFGFSSSGFSRWIVLSTSSSGVGGVGGAMKMARATKEVCRRAKILQQPEFEPLEHSVNLGRERLGRYSRIGQKLYAAFDAKDRLLGQFKRRARTRTPRSRTGAALRPAALHLQRTPANDRATGR
jgi:hypothetical protein